MIRTCWRAAAAVLTMGCALWLAGAWQQAQAAPLVFQKASDNGTGDDAGRFTAVLTEGGTGEALLQLFTAADPGSRISGLYVQDATGAIAREAGSGGALVGLSQTQVYEVLLDNPGAHKIAVVKTLSTALGISLGAAKALVDRAPVVIRTASTPDGNDRLKQALENVGARVTLTNRHDPSAPVGANVGVTTPGTTPTGYDVVLARTGPNKIAIIKRVRDLTGLGLTEAKKLVDNAPSVIKANVSPAVARAMQQALRKSGATVELKPVGGTAGNGPIVLPPGSEGIAPDIALRFAYLDPDAMPPLQLTLDLDVGFADLLAAWQSGQFLLGLEVTNAAGISDLFLAARAVPPAEVPEPPTMALLLLALLVAGLYGARNRFRSGVRAG